MIKCQKRISTDTHDDIAKFVDVRLLFKSVREKTQVTWFLVLISSVLIYRFQNCVS